MKKVFGYLTMIIFLGCVSSIEIYSQTCAPAPVGLVSWFSGDNNALDSRSRNNGTLGASSQFAAGQVGQAFQTTNTTGNAVTTVAESPDTPSLDFTNAFTIEMWVSPGQVGANNGTSILVCKGNCGSVGGFPYALLLNNTTSNIAFRVGDGSTFDTLFSSPLPLNTFTHLAASYERNGATGTMRIYLNGVLDNSKTTAIGTLVDSSQPLTVGGSTAGNTLGIYDEVSLYNRVLSAAEILQIANAGTAGKCKPTATTAPNNQITWFAGDGNALDSAGTNNGTLQNGAGFAVGKVGQSFNFDGTDDSVQVPTTAINFGTGDFTIDLWFNQNSVSALGPSLFGKSIGSFPNDQTYLLETYNGNLLRFLVRGTTANENDFSLTVSLPANTWHHVVAVRQGNINRLYLNGLQVGQQTAGSNVDTGTTGGTAFIGRLPEVSQRFFNGRIDETSLYNRALTDAEIASIFNAGIAGKLKTATTPTGFALSEPSGVGDGLTLFSDVSNVRLQSSATVDGSDISPQVVNTTIGDATVTFPTVTTAGTTQQIPLNTALFPALTMGTHTGLAYDIATSAVFTGSPTVCFNVPSFTAAQFTGLRVFHFEAGAWVNRTASGNTFPTLCTQGLTSLSPFAIVRINVVAASVSIGGRVSDSFGNAISKARVSMTTPSGETRTAITSSFGYYRFDDVEVGQTYVFNIASKRHQFQPQVISVNDSITDLDFTALP